MEHRWGDVNVDDEVTDGVFVGGCGPADLWISKKNVLICQYEDFTDGYVSYYPTNAIYRVAMGLPMDEHEPGNLPDGKFITWNGGTEAEAGHDALSIARYLAVFVPDAFSEAERNHLLGHGLTQQEGKKE